MRKAGRQEAVLGFTCLGPLMDQFSEPERRTGRNEEIASRKRLLRNADRKGELLVYEKNNLSNDRRFDRVS
jgi:hypothetical protein